LAYISTKNLALLSLIGISILFGTPVAKGHELETGGSVGAIMHVDPDDEPIANEPATFYFDFEYKQRQFNLQGCNCAVTITQNGRQVFGQSLTENTFSYTFPEQGAYVLEVAGKPKPPEEFQDFTLRYDVTVRAKQAGGTGNSPPVAAVTDSRASASLLAAGNHTLHYFLFGAGFLLIGILYLKDKYKAKRLKK
jgi:hypothetical protein